MFLGRDDYATELPDATLDDTPEAVRAFAPASTTLLRLRPDHIAALLAGRLVLYEAEGGALLLCYHNPDADRPH